VRGASRDVLNDYLDGREASGLSDLS
jgi:hypothetical protein